MKVKYNSLNTALVQTNEAQELRQVQNQLQTKYLTAYEELVTQTAALIKKNKSSQSANELIELNQKLLDLVGKQQQKIEELQAQNQELKKNLASK